MADNDATPVMLADALVGSDSEGETVEVLQRRWATWQRDYGTRATTASRSSDQDPPPHQPRLASALERADPAPQPPQARRPRGHAPASSRTPYVGRARALPEPARVLSDPQEPQTTQCETDEWRHMQVRPVKFPGGSLLPWPRWGAGICDLRKPSSSGRGMGGAASVDGEPRKSDGKVLRHAVEQMVAIRRARCKL